MKFKLKSAAIMIAVAALLMAWVMRGPGVTVSYCLTLRHDDHCHGSPTMEYKIPRAFLNRYTLMVLDRTVAPPRWNRRRCYVPAAYQSPVWKAVLPAEEFFEYDVDGSEQPTAEDVAEWDANVRRNSPKNEGD